MKPNFKKMLATIGLLAVAVPTTLSVVACGEGPSEPQKADLSTVVLKTTVKGEDVRNETDLLKALKSIDENSKLVEADVTVENFVAAKYAEAGSAKLVAKTTGHYKGEVPITIEALAQKELSTIVTETQINGDNFNTKDAVLNELKNLNKDLSSADVSWKTFAPATYTSSGQGILVAKDNTEYKGEVTITIEKLTQTQLSTIVTETTFKGEDVKNEADLLNAIKTKNSDLVEDDVTIQNFVAADYGQVGKADLIAKTEGRYEGQVPITIEALDQKELSTIVTETQINGDNFNTKDAVLNELKNLNKDLSSADVSWETFTPASVLEDGQGILIANPNSQYKGKVTITIEKLIKADLKDVITNTTIQGDNVIEENDVIDQILALNPETGVTKADLIVSEFKSASKSAAGSATLSAVTNSKFTGTIVVTIEKFTSGKDFLHRIIINRIVDGNKNNDKDTILTEIIKQNSKLKKDNIFIKDFQKATKDNYGSATVSATTNGTVKGYVKIVIGKVDPTYTDLINALLNTPKETKQKKDAWKSLFAYKQKQFTEIYGGGLLIADLDGEENENVWRFIWYVLASQRNELKSLGIIMDYEEIENEKPTGNTNLNKNDKTLLHTGTYNLKFWDGEKFSLTLKDFKIFYRLNADK